MDQRPPQNELICQRMERTMALAQTGNLVSATKVGLVPKRESLTLLEALVLGFWHQGVKNFFAVWCEQTQAPRHEIGL